MDRDLPWPSSCLDPEIFPGCILTLTYTLVANRSGDTLSATFTRSLTWTGCPGFFEDECVETVTTATRTAEDPDCDLIPVLPTTWTETKTVS